MLHIHIIKKLDSTPEAATDQDAFGNRIQID